MSTRPFPFAACFNDPEHADILLHVCINNEDDVEDDDEPGAKRSKTGSQGSPAPAAAPAAAAAPARSYHCHAIILATLCQYFKAQLSSCWQQPTGSSSSSTPCNSAAKKTIQVHVEAEELDALHELLQMLYTQALPAAAPTQPLFLQCLRLADRFDASSCMDILVGGLAALPIPAIDYSLLSFVFQASPGVCGSHSYAALIKSCSAALVKLFGDTPAVIQDKALLQQFRSLPHAAVLAWIKADDLQVHSENCVVILVSAWVQANPGSTAAQHEELAHRVRVFHLGSAYLYQIVPNLSWFKDCAGMEYMPAVSCCIRAGVRMMKGLEAEAEQRRLSTDFAWPPGWTAKPRKRCIDPLTSSWVMSASQVMELDDGTSTYWRSPPSRCLNGIFMSLTVRVEQAASPKPFKLEPTNTAASSAPPLKTMSLFFGVDGAAMRRYGVPLPAKTLVQLSAVCFKLGRPGSAGFKERKYICDMLLESVLIKGSKDFLDAAAPTFLQLVAPYLQEGQLHISASFGSIDKA